MNRGDILENAHKCVCGDRDEQYGNPNGSFKEIASRWEHYLTSKMGFKIPVTPHDVAMMMTEFKLSRIVTSGGKSGDSFVDGCGYLAIAGELAKMGEDN